MDTQILSTPDQREIRKSSPTLRRLYQYSLIRLDIESAVEQTDDEQSYRVHMVVILHFVSPFVSPHFLQRVVSNHIALKNIKKSFFLSFFLSFYAYLDGVNAIIVNDNYRHSYVLLRPSSTFFYPHAQLHNKVVKIQEMY